tara:strand:- start:100 stop:348 length:249 start_codon:yes stop_codon:yes gene_type:complete
MTAGFPVVITRWQRDPRNEVKVQLTEYLGHPLIEARVYWQASEGDTRPSKNGLTIGVRHLPALISALTAAESKARSLNLIEG